MMSVTIETRFKIAAAVLIVSLFAKTAVSGYHSERSEAVNVRDIIVGKECTDRGCSIGCRDVAYEENACYHLGNTSARFMRSGLSVVQESFSDVVCSGEPAAIERFSPADSVCSPYGFSFIEWSLGRKESLTLAEPPNPASMTICDYESECTENCRTQEILYNHCYTTILAGKPLLFTGCAAHGLQYKMYESVDFCDGPYSTGQMDQNFCFAFASVPNHEISYSSNCTI